MYKLIASYESSCTGSKMGPDFIDHFVAHRHTAGCEGSTGALKLYLVSPIA